MLLEYFSRNPWAAIGTYVALSILDYRLSVIGVRWFRRGADKHYDLGGSYELNPPFEQDIEEERPVSPRQIVFIVVNSGILLGVWWLTSRVGRLEPVFAALFGFYVLSQVPAHIRHVNNIALFRTVVTTGGVSGKTTIERWLDLRQSGLLFSVFSVLWLAMFLLTGEFFFVGGVVGSALLGARFWIFGQEAAERGTVG